MKPIYNWEKASVFDIESDGLLDEATKFHVLSCKLASGKLANIKQDDLKSYGKFINYHLKKEIPLVIHNGVRYDIPLIEKLTGIDCSKLMVIDSLYLSWHLNPKRDKHGLDSFLEDYNIAKPKIDSWEDLSYEEYLNRCDEDVKINAALWEDLKERLIQMFTFIKGKIDSGEVDNKRVSDDEVMAIDLIKGLSVTEHINRYLTFLMSKADMGRLREKTRIKIDTGLLLKTDIELGELLNQAAEKLEKNMPLVPEYTVKNFPKKPTKQDGSLSTSGISWNKAIENLLNVDENGTPMTITVEGDDTKLKVLKKQNPPNINSNTQVKNWLFSHGWKPSTYKYVKDEKAQQEWVDSGFKRSLKPSPRKVPQLSVEGDNGKELCPSVLALIEEVPSIEAYSGYTLIKHRYDVIQGFKNSLIEDQYVRAEVGGLTNTLREKHRKPIVNLPNAKSLYGEAIRSLIMCEDNEVLMGSDLSSLEDRMKNHFCLAFDPEYVESVNQEGYDPHLSMAMTAGMITQEEYDDWTLRGIKSNNAKNSRRKGKTGNYSLVYGCGPETLARSANIPLKEAKALHKAYWKIHWYVQAIADDQYTFTCAKGHKWLINPLNGFPYSVRSDKDIFSTLIQGSGSYVFDVWVDKIMQKTSYEALTLLMHDELAYPIKDTPENRALTEEIVYESIEEVNQMFNMRVKLGCDVQFGKNYSEIH